MVSQDGVEGLKSGVEWRCTLNVWGDIAWNGWEDGWWCQVGAHRGARRGSGGIWVEFVQAVMVEKPGTVAVAVHSVPITSINGENAIMAVATTSRKFAGIFSSSAKGRLLQKDCIVKNKWKRWIRSEGPKNDRWYCARWRETTEFWELITIYGESEKMERWREIYIESKLAIIVPLQMENGCLLTA